MNDSSLHSRILTAVEDAFDEQVGFLADLTRIPSLRGQEASAQDFMAAAMRSRGLAVDRWKVDI
ncbi:MAG: ArgE/DapE family deacylase, partial [Quisquiliibacterium sp.]